MPAVLSTARGRRPRAVLKTKGTVFPYTDRPRQVNNIFIFFPTFASLQINLERLSERAKVSLSQMAGNRGANVIINTSNFFKTQV